jgi:predicted unusual protein kinase regulating ubiquinone biosynthesis (AarF/ABC1/UbiB family)
MFVKTSEICLKVFYNYITSETDTSLTAKAQKVKCLSSVFASYGGILSKVSQMLCMEDGQGEMYADCKPYSREKTIQYIKNEFEINDDDYFGRISSMDFNVYKSGSVGQVHKAVYTDDYGNDTNVVMKVQYVGLRKQFDEDLHILRTLSKFLYNFMNKTTEEEVVSKLYEELDYRIEFKNQQLLCDIWNDDPMVHIPKLIPSLCNETILTSEFVGAEDMFSFVKNSTQEQRNAIGMEITRFIYRNMFVHGVFYSDIHYGNFLVKDKNILVVIDFGCVNIIDYELSKLLLSIHDSVLKDDKWLFYDTVTAIGILDDDIISDESRDYMWEYFKLQFEPLISENFTFTKDWLEIYIHKDMGLMKEWILPNNCIYFNKINFGMSHLLAELNLQGDILGVFKDIQMSRNEI